MINSKVDLLNDVLQILNARHLLYVGKTKLSPLAVVLRLTNQLRWASEQNKPRAEFIIKFRRPAYSKEAMSIYPMRIHRNILLLS